MNPRGDPLDWPYRGIDRGPRWWLDGSSVGCASTAANSAEKSNLTGNRGALASGAHHPATTGARCAGQQAAASSEMKW